MFRIFDTDNNGFISVDEMNKIVEHLFHLVPEGQKEKLETPASVSEAHNRYCIFMTKQNPSLSKKNITGNVYSPCIFPFWTMHFS